MNKLMRLQFDEFALKDNYKRDPNERNKTKLQRVQNKIFILKELREA